MTALSEEPGLLHAVRATPDADLPRLVYCDWLEEHGGVPGMIRARLIREGIDAPRPREFEPGAAAAIHFLFYRGGWHRYDGPFRPEGACSWIELAPATPGVQWVVSRGFVSEVRLEQEAFLADGVAPAWFGTHPIDRVILTDAAPAEVTDELIFLDPLLSPRGRRATAASAGEWFFRCWNIPRPVGPSAFSGHDIRPALFDLLPAPRTYVGEGHLAFYPTRLDALAALSSACLSFGRSPR